MCGSRGGGGGGGGGGEQGVWIPLKNHKNIGFLSNTGPNPLINHKAIKPVFNVGPALACQQTAKDGPLIVEKDPPPPPTKLSRSAHGLICVIIVS